MATWLSTSSRISSRVIQFPFSRQCWLAAIASACIQQLQMSGLQFRQWSEILCAGKLMVRHFKAPVWYCSVSNLLCSTCPNR